MSPEIHVDVVLKYFDGCNTGDVEALKATPMGWALMALTVCVTPANLGMALDADRYPQIGVLGLWLRLAFQPALIWLIWWSTSARRKTACT